jgi:hypothetical protein
MADSMTEFNQGCLNIQPGIQRQGFFSNAHQASTLYKGPNLFEESY